MTGFILGCLAIGASLLPAAAASPPTYPDARFDFALIGDTPYNEAQETNQFPNLIEELNRARLAFIIHDGDIKSGSTPCTDELFERRSRQFATSRHSLIYLFGDNEWSDCGKVKSQPFDPQERLDKLRALFTQGDRSLGQATMRVERQSAVPGYEKFRENVRWIRGRVIFAGLNVPGDDNHFGTPEFGPRNAANIAWIHDVFAVARRESLRAVMLVMQANPQFDKSPTNRVRVGFNEMLGVLERESLAFGRPVVLVHGDSHYYRIDQPLLGARSHRRIENFTRVETFGDPDVHWIKGSVDWRDPNVFTFRPQYVRRNLVRHGP
ncbi:MAG: hypothetical protein QOF48_897 [Verrucomicrobiota bacterium]|jgi:hypothetical protein